MSTEQLVNELWSKIEPFLPLWGTMHVVSAATQRNGKWFNLGSRLEFEVNSGHSASELCLTDSFKLIWKEVPIQEAKNFLLRMVCTNQIPFSEGAIVYLSDPDNQLYENLNWWGPNRVTGLVAQREAEREETCWLLRAGGPSQQTYMSIDELEKLESLVRIRAPIAADLQSLLWLYARGVKVHPNLRSAVDIVAPLPFCVKFVHRHGSPSQICVSAPLRAIGDSLFVLIYTGKNFMKKQQLVTETAKAEQVTGNSWRQTWEFEWPSAFDREAKLHLYYGDEEVDQTSVWRWPYGNQLSCAVDQFFDNEVFLENWLFRDPYGNKKGQESMNFEHGIVRLLVRMGIPAVWYGHKAYQNKPDLAAVIEWAEPPIVLLGECTLRKPMEKLSDFSVYRWQLLREIGKGVKLLQVLFTPVEITESDLKAAKEKEVALVGLKELHEIHGLVGWREKGLEYLEKLAGRDNLESVLFRRGKF